MVEDDIEDEIIIDDDIIDDDIVDDPQAANTAKTQSTHHQCWARKQAIVVWFAPGQPTMLPGSAFYLEQQVVLHKRP